MSISLRNKIITLFVVIALAVTSVFGVMAIKNTINVNAEEAKVYYVSPDATYGTEGEAGNQERPYNVNTLLNSNILQPGDTVKVLPGDYNIGQRIIIRRSGTYNKYITIENASDTEQATFKFYAQDFNSVNRGVSIEADYIHWKDIDVCGAGDNGLYIGGSYNIIEDCEFYDNRDSGLQLGRSSGDLNFIDQWPSYNLIKNCTSHNNYDNQTYGENADGFAAKLTVGYGNVFDSCIAYRNSDDGWDLYAKVDSGNIGSVIMYNCIAFENGYLENTQADCNAKFPTYDHAYDESNTASYDTRDGDGNGFKLGGSVMEGDVVLHNCLAFHNKAHGVTDNSNPGVISLTNVTAYDNNRKVDATGNILKDNSSTEGANIDVARQTYSYNNMKNVLSVKSTAITGLGNDAYRASVQDSVLRNGSDAYIVDGTLDADTKVGINGKKGTALNESVFALIPIDYATSTYTLTGLNDTAKADRVHIKYRNADGSINLGDLFKVVSQPLAGKQIGANFSLSTYAEYDHFDLDNNYQEATSEVDAILEAAVDSLSLACNPAAVYQDFWVPSNMKNVTLTWTSSDETVATVTDKNKEIPSPSRTTFQYVTIHRDIYEDKQVTLTANVTAQGQTKTRDFVITVKMDEPRIGDIYVTNPNGEKVYNGDSYIVNHFSIASEPQIKVINGANYSGNQFVLGEQFTSEVTYMYAPSKLANFIEVKEFTPSNDGVWNITHTVTLKSSGEKAQYSYTIYVASTAANVDFTSSAQIAVNLDGYLISGNLSNVTGYLYALSSSTELEVTPENIKTMEGVERYAFTSDTISCQFANANEGSYYVYYALANMRDQITSEIYTDEIGMVEVDTPEAFMKVAGGNSIGGEKVSKTIYSVSRCLDFTNVTWANSSNEFSGYLDGNGHTIANVTVNGSGLFNKVEGGTIRDLNFDNIVIEAGSAQKNGIIATVYGGSFDNIAITNVRVIGSQRTGAFIGQIFEAPVATTVSRVSVVNPIPTLNEKGQIVAEEEPTAYYVKANGTRASSLIGFIQPSSNPTDDVYVYVKDCFTSTYTLATSYSIGGIVAEYDDSKGANTPTKFLLDIENCYTTSVLVGTGGSSRIGGMVGYHKGGGTLRVAGCFSRSTMYYANLKVEVAQKNISGIMGNFASRGATITRCATIMEEYNTDFGVTAYSESMFQGRFGKSILVDTLGFDTEVWTLLADAEGNLTAPYIALNNADCAC